MSRGTRRLAAAPRPAFCAARRPSASSRKCRRICAKPFAYADRGAALHVAMALLLDDSGASLDEPRRRDDRQLHDHARRCRERPAAGLRLCGRAPRRARGRVLPRAARQIPDHRRRLRYVRPDCPHRRHHPRRSISSSAPACASSRSIPTATRMSSTRSSCLCRGRAPLVHEFFAGVDEHHPDDRAAAVDRAGRRDGVVDHGDARRAR